MNRINGAADPRYNFIRVLLDDLNEARRILRAGARINWARSDCFLFPAPLHSAARTGNLPLVRLLLEYGAGVSLKAGTRQWTALSYAARGTTPEHYAICQLLLERGANCNEQDSCGETALLAAISCRNIKCAQLLLDHGADITPLNKYGMSLLHYAAKTGDENVIQFALDQGIDMECRDNDDRTALHHAVMYSKPEGCELLLKRGALVNTRSSKTGHTPLSLVLILLGISSIGSGHLANHFIRKLHVLLEYGARVTDKYLGTSMLELAVALTLHEVVKNVLIEHMAKMKFLNLNMDAHDLPTIENQEYYNRCLQEIATMRGTKFYNELPLSHILLKSKQVISGYARNEEILKALEGKDYYSEFPIYFSYLKRRFDVEVEKQRLRAPAVNILSRVLKINDPFHPVNQKIGGYLRDEDLKFLQM